jgi:hypothetical protein
MLFTREHALKHRVVGTDIYREIITPKNARTGNFGASKVSWYHKDDPNTHATYEDAAKFKGD